MRLKSFKIYCRTLIILTLIVPSKFIGYELNENIYHQKYQFEEEMLSISQDLDVYSESLAPGWESWSWEGTYDFEAIDMAHYGQYSISSSQNAWGALSLHSNVPFMDKEKLTFWIEGDQPSIRVYFEAPGNINSEYFLLSELATVIPGSWTYVEVSMVNLPTQSWDRINFQEFTGSNTNFHLDDIKLLDSVGYSSAELLGSDIVLLKGSGDQNSIRVELNGVEIPIVRTQEHTDPSRLYVYLQERLSQGTVDIITSTSTFTRHLQGYSSVLDMNPTHQISPDIYGMAFPQDSNFIQDHGTTVARWGGNAVSLYNPFLDVTNVARDWYYENVAYDNVDQWIGEMSNSGCRTFLTVPSLDWVAKDDSSFSYSISKYGDQQDNDAAWRPDAGNGILLDGTPITWNDPTDSCILWDLNDINTWLSNLNYKPDIACVDNELDIASITHQDVHPDPVTYDELLDRFITRADVIKNSLPDAEIAGIASTGWWYYWNSQAGADDKANHGGVDLIQWFLREVHNLDISSGYRRLDYLDLHYYPDGGIYSDDSSPDMKAKRLRATRSLWDPSYTDESWIGTDEWATQAQPNRNQVQLIPRFKELINNEYPGTKLAITEWSFGAEMDMSAGLAIADVLGIFGREDLDLATYWTSPPENSPTSAAFQLYRGDSRKFGDQSLSITNPDPDLLGIYAALDANDKLTLVIVNKHPEDDILIDINSLPAGTYSLRHFSNNFQSMVIADGNCDVNMKICVPSYGAIFLAYESGGVDEYPPIFIYVLILGIIAGSAFVGMIFILIGRIKNHKKVKKRNYSLPKSSEYILRELKPPNSSKNRQYHQYNRRLNNREWHN